jgi:hypothetical protein
MPDQSIHLAKAEANARFAMSLPLESQIAADWAVTALFYSAIHLVEAYFAISGFHSKTHGEREFRMFGSSDLHPIRMPYAQLKTVSLDARYRVGGFSADYVLNHAKPKLDEIQRHIFTMLQEGQQQADTL